MLQCEICGHRLRFRAAWRCLRSWGKLLYPQRSYQGDQVETPVRWLCSRCLGRADRRYRDAREPTSPG